MKKLIELANTLGVTSCITVQKGSVISLAGKQASHVVILIQRKKKVQAYRIPERAARNSIPRGGHMRAVATFVSENEKAFSKYKIELSA